jgi:hypothetical protein
VAGGHFLTISHHSARAADGPCLAESFLIRSGAKKKITDYKNKKIPPLSLSLHHYNK